MTDDIMSRAETLRALLEKHEPTQDDLRGGHHYIYPEADPRVRKGARATKQARVGWMTRRVAS